MLSWIEIATIPKNKTSIESLLVVDVLLISTEYEFRHTFAKNASHPGLYRLYIANNRWIDFIIDNEDVILSTDANNIIDSMNVTSSENNKLYYDYINLNKHYKIKTAQLLAILDKYSKDDKYSVSTRNKLALLQQQYYKFINITAQKNIKSFVARYIRSVQL